MEKYLKDLTVSEFLELIGKKQKIKPRHPLDSFIENLFIKDENSFIKCSDLHRVLEEGSGLNLSKVYIGTRMRLCGFESELKRIEINIYKGYKCRLK